MNRVRVMDFSASGWRASASSACAMALPIASAGPSTPMPMASAAPTVDSIVNHVMSFTNCSFLVAYGLLRLNSAGDVDQREHADDVGLYQRLDDVQHQQRNRHQEA